jgi:hypothetical protein
MSNISSTSPTVPPAPKPWRAIVLESLAPFAGTTLLMEQIYGACARHPDYKLRGLSNLDRHARVRATLQALRDDGMLEWKGKGHWCTPATPKD